MNKELKPCPFEKVKKDAGHNLDFVFDEYGNYERVACSCGARGPVMAYTKQSTIDGWNTRI